VMASPVHRTDDEGHQASHEPKLLQHVFHFTSRILKERPCPCYRQAHRRATSYVAGVSVASDKKASNYVTACDAFVNSFLRERRQPLQQTPFVRRLTLAVARDFPKFGEQIAATGTKSGACEGELRQQQFAGLRGRPGSCRSHPRGRRQEAEVGRARD